MFAKDYRRAAWGKLTGNWTTAVVVYLIYMVLVSIASATGIGSIAVFVFDGALVVGLSIVMLQISRLGSSKIETMFDGFRQGLGNNILAGVLVTIYTLLWSLLFIIPGIVKSYSYAMTFYILADNPNMAPSEAIDASKKMMDGNKWRLFCLDFSFIGWGILCILTFGILTLWVSPYQMMAHAQFYESLKGEAPQDDTFVGGEQQNDNATQL